jgi:hypothetical protein
MLKAIETRYKGYRFRSRLEARWAVFFDALGLAWEYEVEGYDLGLAGWYLPDFWLPDDQGVYACPVWVEVKGDRPTFEEIHKAEELSTQSNGVVIIVVGTPGSEDIYALYRDNDKLGILNPDNGSKGYPIWEKALCCNQLSVRQARESARAARFEHGETPKVKP